MSLQIAHDSQRHRFSVEVDRLQCELDYRLAGSVMTITHTGVPERVAGRGIAGQLMRAALNAARDEGWRVVPACSYATEFMSKHAEFDALRLHA